MEQAVSAVRAFNRFHTRYVGALDAHYLDSHLSLVEARILYEIAARPRPLAADIRAELRLDAGYLSRMLRRFEASGWIDRGRAEDGRRRPIALTPSGRRMYDALDDRTRRAVERNLTSLAESDRRVLVSALGTVQSLLAAQPATYAIRGFRPGDMGLICSRQSILYNEGHGWGRPMEVLLGEVTSAFLRDFKPDREACWIAEAGGRMAGSVFVTDGGSGVAKLRLLYVEPFARGLGIGGELVGRVVDFARTAGYTSLELWTHSVLLSARRLYAAAGMSVVATAMHDLFGKPEQGETWELRF